MGLTFRTAFDGVGRRRGRSCFSPKAELLLGLCISSTEQSVLDGAQYPPKHEPEGDVNNPQILINLILLIYASLVYGLQRLCYGPLRPIEIEQLYEKGWFAVTETCLAMTIFREEVGAWFLVMFVALLTGKVWGWIGDGRVEVLEQQPPANPRLFHIRLSVSLAMSVVYDLWLMQYTINTVVQQARPNMMVMFLFEFAVLSTSSLATTSRYIISLTEARIVKKQTQERLDERRREVREERIELVRQRAAAMSEGTSSETDDAPLPSEEDVDEMDIEVQGWEAKGQWVLTLDLITGMYFLCFNYSQEKLTT